MNLQDNTNLDSFLKNISLITEESFLISHSHKEGSLRMIIQDNNNEILFFSISSKIVFFGEIDNVNNINNFGTLYFKELKEFLDIDLNGYYTIMKENNEHFKLSNSKVKIALGCKDTDYSHLGFFKGSTIKNAFLVGLVNANTIRMVSRLG